MDCDTDAKTPQSLMAAADDGSYISDLLAEADQAIETLRNQYVHKKRGWSFEWFIEWDKL
jgi:hypothetical protein